MTHRCQQFAGSNRVSHCICASTRRRCGSAAPFASQLCSTRAWLQRREGQITSSWTASATANLFRRKSLCLRSSSTCQGCCSSTCTTNGQPSPFCQPIMGADSLSHVDRDLDAQPATASHTVNRTEAGPPRHSERLRLGEDNHIARHRIDGPATVPLGTTGGSKQRNAHDDVLGFADRLGDSTNDGPRVHHGLAALCAHSVGVRQCAAEGSEVAFTETTVPAFLACSARQQRAETHISQHAHGPKAGMD